VVQSPQVEVDVAAGSTEVLEDQSLQVSVEVVAAVPVVQSPHDSIVFCCLLIVLLVDAM